MWSKDDISLHFDKGTYLDHFKYYCDPFVFLLSSNYWGCIHVFKQNVSFKIVIVHNRLPSSAKTILLNQYNEFIFALETKPENTYLKYSTFISSKT